MKIFKDTVCKSDNIGSNDWRIMDREMERKWKGVIFSLLGDSPA